MFASLPHQPPPPPTPTQNMFYLPQQPSPLSPRRSNAQSSRSIFSSMSPSQSKPSTPEQNNTFARRNSPQPTTSSYAQRYAERISNPAANISRRRAPAPTTPSSSASRSRQPASSSSSTSPRDKRRDVFLNRVKRDREEGRFEARAEQILRMEYLAQRRKYEQAMARSAPDLEAVVEGEEDGDEGMGGVWDEADELDQFLEEETDYGALLEILEREDGGDQGNGMAGGEASSFEEDDYDSIFMDMLSSQGPVESPQFSQSMDTS